MSAVQHHLSAHAETTDFKLFSCEDGLSLPAIFTRALKEPVHFYPCLIPCRAEGPRVAICSH